MNRFLLLAVFLAGVCAVAQQTAPQGQPSLADLARKTRAQQKAPAVARYDEESFRNSPPSPPPDNATDSSAENQKAPDTKAADDKAKDAVKSKDDFKSKIEAQKNEVAMLQREIDVIQREQRLRAAAFYGDAGTQMREQAKFAEESRKQQEDLDTKKQALEAAQQKLADIQEQARKAGTRSE